MNLLSLFGCASGSRNSIKQQRSRLYRMAYAWGHDAALAEDLVQETLIRALERVDQLRHPERVEPWLYAILLNCWRDHLRCAHPHEDIDTLVDVLSDGRESPEQAGERGDMAAQVHAAIARLPVIHREVLTLVDLEELSYAEVGDILSIPLGTVMSRLSRARAQLRQSLRTLDPANEVRSRNVLALRRVK